MSYEMWLSFNNQQEGFQLPVNPSRIEMSDGNKGTTYDINALGEINVIKDRKLTTYRFESFFPALDKGYNFMATNRLLDPYRYVEFIQEWMDSKRPIRFIFVGSSFRINVAASIEQFDWREVAGGMGDIEYSLALKKYEFYSAQKVEVKRSPVQIASAVLEKSQPQRPNDRQPPKLYTLKAGDSLWSVAKSQLGDGTKWSEIKRLNNITDAQITNLPIGMELRLPDGDTA